LALSKEKNVGRANVAAIDQNLTDELQELATGGNETAIGILVAIGPMKPAATFAGRLNTTQKYI
jgi:hypothetical protein